ncbi:serine hydrolase [Flavisolibacter sp. BT320]|nr:serine hydrolase [Flavisolibacter longurius]
MKFFLLLTVATFALISCKKEADPVEANTSIYFPPTGSTEWATTTPESLDWNTANIPALYTYLEAEQTKAFLVLKDGKIVLEKYFGQNLQGTGPFTQNSFWYWASAGKTLTGFVVGKAQQEGFLNIGNKTSQYLGNGWTSLAPEKEALITVRHQLTMTTGLDDGTGDAGNTAPAALLYKADAGTRWAYHNAPYTLLQKVVATATGQSFASYFDSRLKNKIGLDGQWILNDNDNVYWSTPRSMARFGILVQAKGWWNGSDILGDAAYLNAAVTTSQNLNLSYGYLWWLNGKASAMLPQSQIVFPQSLCPAAPADMVSAMGKNGQLLSIVPSKGLIVVRMGHNTDGSYVPTVFQNGLWEKLNAVIR